MKNWDMYAISKLIRECGEIALRFYDNPGTELKDDLSLVTKADKAIESVMAEHFDIPEENTYMIGEETVIERSEEYIHKAINGRAWIVDPIDGTSAYANHLPTWGISIGFSENGVIREGAIFLPVSEELFVTEKGNIFYSDKVLSQTDWNPDQLVLFSPSPKKLSGKGLISISQELAKYGHMNFNNPVHAISSCVYSLTSLFQGYYLAYTGTVKLWDMAAGIALLKNCGFICRTKSGIAVSDDISDQFYNLAPENPQRWKVKDVLIFAPSDTIADYLLTHIEFK